MVATVAEFASGSHKLTFQSLPGLCLVLLTGLLVWSMYTLHTDHKDIKSEMTVTNYLLSLPPDKRPQLAMPPALRGRIVPR